MLRPGLRSDNTCQPCEHQKREISQEPLSARYVDSVPKPLESNFIKNSLTKKSIFFQEPQRQKLACRSHPPANSGWRSRDASRCRSRAVGWKIATVGCRERRLPLFQQKAGLQQLQWGNEILHVEAFPQLLIVRGWLYNVSTRPLTLSNLPRLLGCLCTQNSSSP